MGAVLVYGGAVAISTACAALLYRGWRRSGSPLLRSAAICFAGLALNDVGRILDVFVFPDVDLIAVRSLPALAGLLVLVHALVKEGAR